MKNMKKAKVDYAAIIRKFEMYGRGRSQKNMMTVVMFIQMYFKCKIDSFLIFNIS